MRHSAEFSTLHYKGFDWSSKTTYQFSVAPRSKQNRVEQPY
ncbi:hypothetical protein PALB_17840 [Pseudoalteromonas luteoviolacea B = ATCC 29581]|nr:hypothetical protein PALB_17840 [Pseudoalteromonas luteoviolacea B = ATCC 29581]